MADVQTPPPQVDTQDPLPESNWFWRRIFIFGVSTVIILGIYLMVQTMVDLASGQPSLIVGAFVKIIGWLLLYAWFAMTYYMVAPSAEQVTKMWQAATMFKSGVVSTTTQTATGADGSRAVAQTVTGVAPMPTPDISLAPAPLSNTGLPETTGTYTGPDLDDVPTPPAATPEEAPWRPS